MDSSPRLSSFRLILFRNHHNDLWVQTLRVRFVLLCPDDDISGLMDENRAGFFVYNQKNRIFVQDYLLEFFRKDLLTQLTDYACKDDDNNGPTISTMPFNHWSITALPCCLCKKKKWRLSLPVKLSQPNGPTVDAVTPFWCPKRHVVFRWQASRFEEPWGWYPSCLTPQGAL